LRVLGRSGCTTTFLWRLKDPFEELIKGENHSIHSKFFEDGDLKLAFSIVYSYDKFEIMLDEEEK
jgi:sRNA-binding regulator protein Hfq